MTTIKKRKITKTVTLTLVGVAAVSIALFSPVKLNALEKPADETVETVTMQETEESSMIEETSEVSVVELEVEEVSEVSEEEEAEESTESSESTNTPTYVPETTIPNKVESTHEPTPIPTPVPTPDPTPAPTPGITVNGTTEKTPIAAPEGYEEPEATKKPQGTQKPESTKEPAATIKPEDDFVEHKHDYKVIQTFEATCAYKGSTVYRCACGSTYEGDETEMLAHEYKETVIAPTEAESGYTLHLCVNCGDMYKDTYVAYVAPTPTPKPTSEPTKVLAAAPIQQESKSEVVLGSAPLESETATEPQSEVATGHTHSDIALHEETQVGGYTYVYCSDIEAPYKDGTYVYYPYEYFY